MGHDRPCWRIRLSTLMLLVIILGLAMTRSLTAGTGSRNGGDSRRRWREPSGGRALPRARAPEKIRRIQ